MVRTLVWWTVAAASAILSIFFLFVGISLCRAAYDLEHPYQFILTFFSSNLIILISVVILLGVVLRMIGRLRRAHSPAVAASPRLTPDSSQPARIFHELLSRDHEDGRATGQPSRGTAGLGSEACLNGTSQEPTPEDARKDDHIRGRSK